MEIGFLHCFPKNFRERTGKCGGVAEGRSGYFHIRMKAEPFCLTKNITRKEVRDRAAEYKNIYL